MALSKDDRDWFEKTMTAAIENHVAICPHGRYLFAQRWLMIGLAIGSGALGTAGGFLLSFLTKGPV